MGTNDFDQLHNNRNQNIKDLLSPDLELTLKTPKKCVQENNSALRILP
jgi:hypothetical protein